MRRTLFLAAGLLTVSLLTPGSIRSQTPPSPVTLPHLRDRYRPLLLFAATPEDPSLLAQLTQLKGAAAGLKERDVLLIAVPYKDPSPSEVSLSAADAQAARRFFHVAPADFTAILLGKDGGEKYRAKKPISFEKLKAAIDAMPMRREEAKAATGH